MIAMACTLGLTVVAEGVETGAQIDFLRQHGCEQIQGYRVGRPVNARAFEADMRKHRASAYAATSAQASAVHVADATGSGQAR